MTIAGAEEGPDDTERAEQLSRQKRATRADVVDDRGTPVGSADEGALPGVTGFGAIARVAPFLWLWSSYAAHLYPRHKTQRARAERFVQDHRWIVRVCFLLDLLVRVILVAIVLLVILKGIWPLPWMDLVNAAH